VENDTSNCKAHPEYFLNSIAHQQIRNGLFEGKASLPIFQWNQIEALGVVVKRSLVTAKSEKLEVSIGDKKRERKDYFDMAVD
jgi:hypothetical protein